MEDDKEVVAQSGDDGVAKHTPTPWGIYHEPEGQVFIGTAEGEPWFICRIRHGCNEHGQPEGVEDKANAEFIVRAVNHHDELVAMLEEVAAELEYAAQYKDDYLREKHGDAETVARARALVAKAKGEVSQVGYVASGDHT